MSARAVTIKVGSHTIIVDREDAAMVRFGRVAVYAGGKTHYVHVDGEPLHRTILKRTGVDLEGLVVDHMNGSGLDNRRSNLRPATNVLNARNLAGPHCDNASGYLGVSWHSIGRKWQARIKVGRKQTYLGLFRTPEEAHAARLAAEEKYFGVQPRREWAHAA